MSHDSGSSAAACEPSSWLRLRACRRDIRAPCVGELYQPLTTVLHTVGALTLTVSGGNTKRVAEVASTTTAGFAFFGAGWPDGLRLSVDYYNIDIRNAIAAPC